MREANLLRHITARNAASSPQRCAPSEHDRSCASKVAALRVVSGTPCSSAICMRSPQCVTRQTDDTPHSKSVIITDLPITILYQLSAPLLKEDIALTVAQQVVDGDVERTNKAVKAAKAATEQAQRSEQAALPTVGALSFFGQCACTKLAIAPTAFALRTRYPLCVTTVYKNLTRSYIHVQYR